MAEPPKDRLCEMVRRVVPYVISSFPQEHDCHGKDWAEVHTGRARSSVRQLQAVEECAQQRAAIYEELVLCLFMQNATWMECIARYGKREARWWWDDATDAAKDKRIKDAIAAFDKRD